MVAEERTGAPIREKYRAQRQAPVGREYEVGRVVPRLSMTPSFGDEHPMP
jgi:hypothetical protein